MRMLMMTTFWWWWWGNVWKTTTRQIWCFNLGAAGRKGIQNGEPSPNFDCFFSKHPIHGFYSFKYWLLYPSLQWRQCSIAQLWALFVQFVSMDVGNRASCRGQLPARGLVLKMAWHVYSHFKSTMFADEFCKESQFLPRILWFIKGSSNSEVDGWFQVQTMIMKKGEINWDRWTRQSGLANMTPTIPCLLAFSFLL